MERTTQRWTAILVIVVAIYALLLMSRWAFGVSVLPW